MVEPNVEIRSALGAYLRRRSELPRLEAVVTGSHAEALRRISGPEAFDGLITSFASKKDETLDGLDTATRFHERFPRASILAVTDEDRENPRVSRLLRLPNTHWLPKPIRFVDLEAKVAMIGFRERGKGCVLVIEDDAETRDQLVDLLALYGFSTMAAGNETEAALVLAAGPRPDAILVDLLLPNEGAASFARRKSRMGHLAPVPLIAMDGRPSPSPAPDVPFHGYLARPADAPELLETLIGQAA